MEMMLMRQGHRSVLWTVPGPGDQCRRYRIWLFQVLEESKIWGWEFKSGQLKDGFTTITCQHGRCSGTKCTQSALEGPSSNRKNQQRLKIRSDECGTLEVWTKGCNLAEWDLILSSHTRFAQTEQKEWQPQPLELNLTGCPRMLVGVPKLRPKTIKRRVS